MEAAPCVKGLWGAVEELAEFSALELPQRTKLRREARGFMLVGIIISRVSSKNGATVQALLCQVSLPLDTVKASLIDAGECVRYEPVHKP